MSRRSNWFYSSPSYCLSLLRSRHLSSTHCSGSSSYQSSIGTFFFSSTLCLKSFNSSPGNNSSLSLFFNISLQHCSPSFLFQHLLILTHLLLKRGIFDLISGFLCGCWIHR